MVDKKLTPVQERALQYMVDNKIGSLTVTDYAEHGIRQDVIERLAAKGYVEHINSLSVILTPAGAAAIGRADLFDAPPAAPADALRQALRDVNSGQTEPVATLWEGIDTLTPAEGDIIDRLVALAERYDDSLIVPLQEVYERYENHPVLQEHNAALRQQLAEQIDHAAILAADRKRLIAALEAIKDLPDSADFLTAWSIAVAALRGEQ